MDFKQHLTMDSILGSYNVAELMDEDDLRALGTQVFQNYDADQNSRGSWEEMYAESMNLAMQVMEEKTFPWPNASNVKFPLITIAALNYHARAYPALIPAEGAVLCRVIGDDIDGKKLARAERVRNHMNFQLTEEDTQWEEGMDKALLVQSIIGCAFKKTYYDAVSNINRSELVFPKDLVVNYYTKSLEKAPRVTHVVYMSRNDIHEREMAGLYVKTDINNKTIPIEDNIQYQQDKEQGITAPSMDESTPYTILEHHCFFDLDGDGYAEPYVVWVRADTQQVLRVIARFYTDSIRYTKDGLSIQSIVPELYFTKIPFIPSPDGGFYDMGFGLLLGATNETINTIINQLTDAGTMATTSGGFLSRGIRIRGGDYSFRPNEWKRTETTGEELKNGLVPLPVREPSPVLLQLLQLMIEFGTKIGMATDPMTGVSPGQNTPAETSRTTIQQGEKVFNGIYKRTYRALKEEFRKLYRLNYIYAAELAPTGKFEYAGTEGAGGSADYQDYFESDKSIVPAADPNISSDTGKMEQAMFLHGLASSSPGFAPYEVMKRILKAAKISNPEQVYPDPKGPNAIPPQPNPKVQIEQMKNQFQEKKLQLEAQMEQIQMQMDMQLNQAKIMKLEAEAANLMAQADDVKNGHMIALLNLQIAAAKDTQAHYQSGVKMLYDVIQGERKNAREERVGALEKPAGNAGGSALSAPASPGSKGPVGGAGVPKP
jgi:chaperonin GroES